MTESYANVYQRFQLVESNDVKGSCTKDHCLLINDVKTLYREIHCLLIIRRIR